MSEDTGLMDMFDGVEFHGTWQQQSAAAAAKVGAAASLQFWAFNRASWGGKDKGFHVSWSNDAPAVKQAVQALAPLQAKAIEIGESKKKMIPCCCCCPPGFTDASAKEAAKEMRDGGFQAEASAAVAASGFHVQIHSVELANEVVTTDEESGTSSQQVVMFLIPGVKEANAAASMTR